MVDDGVDEPANDPVGEPASDRVRLRRGAARGRYADDEVRAILDAGLVAHVGVDTPDGPIVLPMAYGRTDDTIYVHGSAANSLLRTSRGQEICVTVTLIDGLVFARTPFHNSMNYRSVVIRGEGRVVDDPGEHLDALRIITDHVVANWDHGRPPNDIEIRKTMVIALPLAEASAKVRRGDPVDEPDDLSGPHWAGTVAIETRFAAPSPADDLGPGIAVPEVVERLGGSSAFEPLG